MRIHMYASSMICGHDLQMLCPSAKNISPLNTRVTTVVCYISMLAGVLHEPLTLSSDPPFPGEEEICQECQKTFAGSFLKSHFLVNVCDVCR